MRTNSLKSLVLAFALVLFVSGAALAQENVNAPANNTTQTMPGEKGHRMMKHHDMEKGDRQQHAMLPNLTDTQKKQMTELSTKHMEAMLPIKNQLNEKKAHLQTLLSASTVDNKEVDKVVNEISALETSKLKEAINHHQQVRAILTPEQRVIFDSKPKPFLNEGCDGGHRKGRMNK